MADFRHPNINAPTTEGQLNQLKTYLYQLTNQLNYAVKSVKSKENEERYKVTIQGASNGSGTNTGEPSAEEKAQSTFNDVKNLIIKSADIVNAYYDVISKKLEGSYSALAIDGNEYHEFKEEAEHWIDETPKYTENYFKAVQTISKYLGKDVDEKGQPIIPDGEKLSEIRTDRFYIKTGWIYTDDDGHEVGGIELGQISDDGTETDAAFAHFTTEELVFFDGSKNKLAKFSKGFLEITEARIGGNVILKDYVMDNSDGLAFLWAGDD